MIAAFLRLDGDQRIVVLRAALRLVSLKLRWSRPRVGQKTGSSGCRVDSRRARRLAHLVRRTAETLPFATTCLDRAFVLTSLLEAESLEATLRIGIRPDPAKQLDAHAWVEHAGEKLLFDDERDYHSFEAPLTANWR